MLPHPQSVAKTGSTLPAFQRECQLKLSLSQPNRQSKLEMLQQEVEQLLYSFSSQTGAFIVTSWWEVICLLPTYDAQLCLSRLHQHLSAFAKYFKHIMLPHPQSVAKTGSTLPAFERDRQLRSSAFPNQTDNLSLRCFSRKSNNYSFSRLVPSLLLHGGR